MLDDDKPEIEERYFPSKPPASPIIAAIAVAIAMFVVGAFIKTNRQLEELQKEYKRQAEELEWLKRQRVRTGASSSRRGASLALPPLPPAAKRPAKPRSEEVRPSAVPAPVAPPPVQRPGAWQGEGSSLPDLGAGARVPNGGAAAAAPAAASGAKVIASSPEKKMLLVEGGRDRNFSAGDILEVRRDGGAHVADVRVESVYDNQSVCQVLQESSPPLPGDDVALGRGVR